jgi:hypothetical protein
MCSGHPHTWCRGESRQQNAEDSDDSESRVAILIREYGPAVPPSTAPPQPAAPLPLPPLPSPPAPLPRATPPPAHHRRRHQQHYQRERIGGVVVADAIFVITQGMRLLYLGYVKVARPWIRHGVVALFAAHVARGLVRRMHKVVTSFGPHLSRALPLPSRALPEGVTSFVSAAVV